MLVVGEKNDREGDEVREVSAWSVAPRDGALSVRVAGWGKSLDKEIGQWWGKAGDDRDSVRAGEEVGGVEGGGRVTGYVAASSGTLSIDVESHASRAMPDY